MELKLVEVAERIRTLRDIMEFTEEEMADDVHYNLQQTRRK